MCQLISFLHRPDNGDIAVYDLTSHSNTQKKLGLTEPLWCEGHYLPNGEIVCRVSDKNKETKDFCNERLKSRFPTFIDFFLWAISQENIISTDDFDLSGLTSLPAGIKFPEKISGYLYLRGLTSLPAGIKFPEKISGSLCDSLYLRNDLKSKYIEMKSKKVKIKKGQK